MRVLQPPICPHCRAGVQPSDKRCPHCGEPLPQPWSASLRQAHTGLIQKPPGTHSVGFAVGMALIPCAVGLGQFTNDQTPKGTVIVLVTEMLAYQFFHHHDAAGILWLLMYVLSVVDAARIARKLRRGQPIRPWEFF